MAACLEISPKPFIFHKITFIFPSPTECATQTNQEEGMLFNFSPQLQQKKKIWIEFEGNIPCYFSELMQQPVGKLRGKKKALQGLFQCYLPMVVQAKILQGKKFLIHDY